MKLLLDTHDHEVPPGVWDVYRAFLEQFGPRPTLVEWDAHLPPFDEVAAQARRAAEIEQAFRRSARRA